MKESSLYWGAPPGICSLALLLIIPATLLAANLLALWPCQRAAGLRPGHILRTE